jgi:hypothetical protein
MGQTTPELVGYHRERQATQLRSLYRPGADRHRMARPVLPPARILGEADRSRSPAACRQPFERPAGLVFLRSGTSVSVLVTLLAPPPLKVGP